MYKIWSYLGKKHFNNDIFFIVVNKKRGIIQWKKEKQIFLCSSLRAYTCACAELFYTNCQKIELIIFSINYNKAQ